MGSENQPMENRPGAEYDGTVGARAVQFQGVMVMSIGMRRLPHADGHYAPWLIDGLGRECPAEPALETRLRS